MITELFIGKRPSHFRINPVVKAFIISECFLWAAWNFITPIFAIFATQEILNGRIELAASAYSFHLISRVVCELVTGKYLAKSTQHRLYLVAITGICILTIAYLGFTFTTTIPLMFLFYGLAGVGLGIASPAKNTLFSGHLDKDKETMEWSLTDAMSFIAIAFAAALGGFVAATYGFRTLFFLSALVNILATLPYFLYMRKLRQSHPLNQ